MNKITFVAMIVAAAITATAHADLAPKSSKKLQDEATHIAVGSVKAIYTHRTEDKQFIKTAGVVEIQVSSVEKGEGIMPGGAIYARFWTQRWNEKGSPPQPFALGHELPKVGDFVRVYLQRKNGGYDAIAPNGFEKLKQPPKSEQSTGTADLQGTWDFVYYEEKGVVEQPGTKQFVISNNTLDFRAGGESRIETTIEVDPAQRHFTQKFKDGQVYRSIFTRVGDLLILCGNRDKDRPAKFVGSNDKGGEFFIVLKRE